MIFKFYLKFYKLFLIYHQFIIRKYDYCNCNYKFILSGCYFLVQLHTTQDYIRNYPIHLCSEKKINKMWIRIRIRVGLIILPKFHIMSNDAYGIKIWYNPIWTIFVSGPQSSVFASVDPNLDNKSFLQALYDTSYRACL